MVTPAWLSMSSSLHERHKTPAITWQHAKNRAIEWLKACSGVKLGTGSKDIFEPRKVKVKRPKMPKAMRSGRGWTVTLASSRKKRKEESEKNERIAEILSNAEKALDESKA